MAQPLMAEMVKTSENVDITKEKIVEITVADVDESPNQDSEEEEELIPRKRKSGLTDRKRQINAAWDDFTAQEAQKCVEEDHNTIKIIDDNLLPTKGLINEFESDNIVDKKREYQVELFERAKKENVIAVLPTGSGKTLIAVLLLQYIIEKELEDRKAGQPRRLSFFLVEVTTLVLQQGSVLGTNLSHAVARFCGEMDVDSWGKDTWKEHFDTNMVIVLTAEVLYNCLASGFITMQDINLLILDEAHHTKKNHPYARIIRDFYEPTPKANRPKIFGTTASPVDAKVDPIQAAQDLEKTLHAKIATIKNLKALDEFISLPEEKVSRYHHLQEPRATPLCAEIEKQYGGTRLLHNLILRLRILTAELGEWAGDKWLGMALMGDEGDKLERRLEAQFASDPVSRAIYNEELENIKAARHIVENVAQQRLESTPKLEIPDLSSKVLRLKEILDDAYSSLPDTRCIVFVERRATARLLLEIFRYHGHVKMRSGLLIGNRQQELGDQKISIREQLRNMNQFKDGKINVLFATSVAEEGLDIPLCNLVVRFDLYKTMIQYVQSRGRARHKNSNYIHMLEDGNNNHLNTYKEIQQEERKLRDFCSNQSADRTLEDLDADLEKSILDRIGDYYVEPSTGAKLVFGSVLGQLEYFAACVPRSHRMPTNVEYVVTSRGKKFTCEVFLPPGSPLRSMIGKEYTRKSLAKRSAAFEACVELRRRNLLNENMLPTYHQKLPTMRNAHLALHSKKGEAYELLLKPTFWEETWGTISSKLFMVVMKADHPEKLEHPIEPMLMLTREPLPEIPSFPVYPKPGIKLQMSVTTLQGSISVSDEDLKALNGFTLRIYKDCFNKVFEDNVAQMSYWLAPANMPLPNSSSCKAHRDQINWVIINSVTENAKPSWTISTPASELEHRFFVDDCNGGHRYYSLQVDTSLKATDRPPEGVVKKDYMDSIIDWTSSLWKKARKKIKFDPGQPVLQAYKLPLRRNWLSDWDDEDLVERTKAWICPQPLRISTIPLPNVVMAYILPALIWRIDAHLVALEGCATLDLPIASELALEAMTKDSNNTDEHREEQIQVQRGMGKNYERLEFIGDAFLKMATSISLYAGNAEDDEFHFHVKRMLMICNKNLFDHAIKNKLYQYIRTEEFNRRTWYPEGLVLKEGKGANAKNKVVAGSDPAFLKHTLRTHRLNDKTIADVCEALIGASLLTERGTGCMDMAVKAVTVLVKNKNHTAKCWQDYYEQYKMPSYQIAQASAAQISVAEEVARITGYHFICPRVLASAFTHPSWPFNWGQIPCYQRLEFLGDSLFDMACVNFLFHRHPDKDPQWLTEHKMAMVSNRFLGALCVKLGFHKFLKKSINSLIFEIKNYVEAIQEAEAESNGAKDYWTTATNPPKCLPDIVEAYIGAIFVDSCFSYSVIESFFANHVQWFFEDMSVYDTFANNHPTTFLGSLLTNTFHCCHYSIQAREMPTALDGGLPRIAAGVMVHFKVIANDISSSSKSAKVRASKKAIELLQDMSIEKFKQKYGCDCSVAAGKDGGKQIASAVGTAI